MQIGDSTDVYKMLQPEYAQLKAEYEGFKYSYRDIIKDMYTIANAVDTNDSLSASVKADLTKKLDAVAYDLTKIEVLNYGSVKNPFDASLPFNDDGSINIDNRVMSSDGVKIRETNAASTTSLNTAKAETAYNHSHWALSTDMDALKDAYDAATKAPETPEVATDVDGNGEFELADVVEFAKIYANGTSDLKYDFDGNGKVELADVVELARLYANK